MRVVFDMDGTLADNSAREHLARAAAGAPPGPEKSAAWDEFHSHIMDDVPIEAVRQTLYALFNTHLIEIWTARPEKYRDVTRAWLAVYDIPYHKLRMRPDGDWRKSPELKLGWHQEDHADLVFEDHPETTKVLRAAGAVVAQVGEQTNA